MGVNPVSRRPLRPGSPEIESSITEAGRNASAMILSNHGSAAAGSSLESAVNAAEELEVSAQLALMTDRSGS